MPKLRIVAAQHREVRWPLVPRGAARHAGTERIARIVAVRAASGATGLGEAAPLPELSRDSLADAERALDAFVAALPLVLADPRDASQLAAQLAPPRAYAARFAIETALLAAWAQQHRTSLADLFAARPKPALRCAVVVDDVARARAAVAGGARSLKIKVGGDPEADLRRVRAIAQHAPGASLRLDANRGWPHAHTRAILGELTGLPIEYVEEPCRGAHELLDTALPCRLALDESLGELSAGELARALASPHLAALVLKPTLLGGIARCLALAALARAHGVAPIASHTLEGPIGMAACTELARAIAAEGASEIAVGLAPHPALEHFQEATWSAPRSA